MSVKISLITAKAGLVFIAEASVLIGVAAAMSIIVVTTPFAGLVWTNLSFAVPPETSNSWAILDLAAVTTPVAAPAAVTLTISQFNSSDSVPSVSVALVKVVNSTSSIFTTTPEVPGAAIAFRRKGFKVDIPDSSETDPVKSLVVVSEAE